METLLPTMLHYGYPDTLFFKLPRLCEFVHDLPSQLAPTFWMPAAI